MKQTLTLLTVLLLTASPVLFAADESRLAAAKSADDKRMAAMKSGDRAGLSVIFSDELRYAHSSGVVDTKPSFIETLSSGKTKYLSFDYEERNFTFPSSDIALMTGRVRIRTTAAETTTENFLSFLAVWREEKGQWRFLAWQSCKLVPTKTL